ncbi:hypothetical protein [Hymenobacter jejuensis]|nr:hypothetical protein [Hymenobacter jejuensis]
MSTITVAGYYHLLLRKERHFKNTIRQSMHRRGGYISYGRGL